MADTQLTPETHQEDKAAEDTKQAEEVPEKEESDEWKADKYRNKVVERIQDEITKTESQVPKSAVELEKFVFTKAKSRKDYRDLVARLLFYVYDFNKNKNKNKDGQGEGEGGKKSAESKEKGADGGVKAKGTKEEQS